MRQGLRILAAMLLLGSSLTLSKPCHAQNIAAEERFHDLFVTAGYGTAFGAAMGTALLSFQSEPNKNLRYIAIGASLGFIGGSVFGSYIVFSPVFSTPGQADLNLTAPAPTSVARIKLAPGIDPETGKISGIWSAIRLAEF